MTATFLLAKLKAFCNLANPKHANMLTHTFVSN